MGSRTRRAWTLDRSVTAPGSTYLHELEGWGISHPNLVVLKAELRRLPPQPQWGPLCLPQFTRESGNYWAPPRKIRTEHRVSKAEGRREAFLQALISGMTVEQAIDHVGLALKTYQTWRHRHPDFRLKVDRIKFADRIEFDRQPSSENPNKDFVSRRRFYFGYETFTHHHRIIQAMEDTPPGGITMILLPPEAGKTTLITDWVDDKIALNPDERILYVSETTEGQAPAAKVLAHTKDRMTNLGYNDPDANYPTHIPEWHARYGPFRDDELDTDKPWNRKYIKVHKAGARKDWTFQIAAWRSKTYGARCDWLIFDDVQSREGLNSTEAILARMRLTFFTRPGKSGRIVIIGTRVGVDDIYERLAEDIPDRMIRIVQIPALDEHGNSYCPEMWPIEDLENKRAIVGEDTWTTGYMMQPQHSGAVTFPEALLDEARDKGLTYGQRQPYDASLIITGLDPALGGGNALVCAQTTADRFNILAAQVDYGLARNEDIFNHIRSFCRYHFTELVVEKNSQQRGIARDDRLREMAKIYGFRIVEHETGQNKWDFVFGVGAMAGAFIKGEIRFPDATKDCRRRMEPLRGELLAWRPNVDPKLLRQDLVMALWFTWLIWSKRRKSQKRKGKDPSWQTGGTPWRPGDMSGSWNRVPNARRSALVS